jgi:error-prone DNA polymerase
MNGYAQLHSLSNFSFLRSASHPQELVEQAYLLGYSAIAITDECSFAGIVKAHVRAKELGIKLIIGSEFHLQEGLHLVALAPNRRSYQELSGLITLARRRMPKGQYQLRFEDLQFRLKNCLIIWPLDVRNENSVQ